MSRFWGDGCLSRPREERKGASRVPSRGRHRGLWFEHLEEGASEMQWPGSCTEFLSDSSWELDPRFRVHCSTGLNRYKKFRRFWRSTIMHHDVLVEQQSYHNRPNELTKSGGISVSENIFRHIRSLISRFFSLTHLQIHLRTDHRGPKTKQPDTSFLHTLF